MIRVQLRAPSPAGRAALAALLADHDGLRIVGEGQPAEVVLADLQSGDAWLERQVLAEGAGDAPVVALLDSAAARRLALRRGARAALPTDASGDELAAAIQAVAAGLVVWDAADGPGDPPPPRSPAPLEALTPREIEVLQLLAAGLGNKQIAARLGISPHTAKFHVASLLGKLGAASRAEAVALGLRRGLLML